MNAPFRHAELEMVGLRPRLPARRDDSAGDASMTPTQERLIAYLRARPGQQISAYELRDECIPGRTLDNVRVQLFHARRKAPLPIFGKTGVAGGYTWREPA